MAELDVHCKLPRNPQLGVQAQWRKGNSSANEHVQAMQLGQDNKEACQQAAGAPKMLGLFAATLCNINVRHVRNQERK